MLRAGLLVEGIEKLYIIGIDFVLGFILGFILGYGLYICWFLYGIMNLIN